MSGAWPALVFVLAAAGCTRAPRAAPWSDTDATAMLHRADELAANGSSADARQLYRTVTLRFRGTPAAADALWSLGRLYTDPSGRLHDWGAADATFARLATEYPDSTHADEARAWHAALSELLRQQASAQRLRTELDRLKDLDLEEERRR
jgi:TolA-binding protein